MIFNHHDVNWPTLALGIKMFLLRDIQGAQAGGHRMEIWDPLISLKLPELES